jgi:hypothetical protein
MSDIKSGGYCQGIRFIRAVSDAAVKDLKSQADSAYAHSVNMRSGTFGSSQNNNIEYALAKRDASSSAFERSAELSKAAKLLSNVIAGIDWLDDLFCK